MSSFLYITIPSDDTTVFSRYTTGLFMLVFYWFLKSLSKKENEVFVNVVTVFVKTGNQRKTREKKSNKHFVKVLSLVFFFKFLFFVCKTGVTFFHEKSVTVVDMLDMRLSCKLVKSRRRSRSVQFN